MTSCNECRGFEWRFAPLFDYDLRCASAAKTTGPCGGEAWILDMPGHRVDFVQDVFWAASVPQTIKGRGGELAIAVEGKLLCNKLAGHFDQALADHIMSRCNLLVAQHHELTVFSDWLQMASYETSCRRTMTDWGVRLGRTLKGFHVIAGASLVKMGLSVASILVPALQTHSHMASFVAAYQAAKRGRVAS